MENIPRNFKQYVKLYDQMCISNNVLTVQLTL
jgi:hypothetical protein